MSDIEKLTELFMRFPGIGPRQARRFVYFLLQQDDGYRNALTRALSDAVASVKQCSECLRFAPLHKKAPVCDLCASPNRSRDTLMLVEKDTDVEHMERSGAYDGYYVVLGGTLSLTGKKGAIRERELAQYLKKHGASIKEIILALSATPDGEHTSEYLKEKITDGTFAAHATITVLGRGLSTGSELEYADTTTLTQALKNRA